MKRLLSILILSILGFSACSSVNPNTPMQNITKENLNSFKKLIGLEDDMGVFYVMHGLVDGKEQGAYLEITKPSYEMSDGDTSDRVTIKLIESDDVATFNLSLGDLSFGIDSGNLILVGSFYDAGEKIDFHLTQDSNAKINKIYFVESKKEEILKNKNGEDFPYSSTIRKPIIPDSTLPNVDKLNKYISGTSNIEELRQNLESYLKNEYDDRLKGFDIDNGGFGLAYEELSSIGYIDDNILEVDTYSYTYEGGAHGVYGITSELYDINTGEQITGKPIPRQSYGAYWLQSNGFYTQGEDIPDSIWEVFDINDKNKEAFLALLGLYLESKVDSDRLFSDALPLKIFPSSFFLGANGMDFRWDIYAIAPYSSGAITIRVPYIEIMDYMRDGILKDYINAIGESQAHRHKSLGD